MKRIISPEIATTAENAGQHVLFGLVTLTVAAFLSFVWVLFAAVAQAEEPGVACSGRDLIQVYATEAPEKLAEIEAEAAKVPNGEGIFWKIERDGSEPSYLFGTMHMADERIARLTRARLEAFNNADTVVVESVDALDQQKTMAAMMGLQHLTMLTDGTTLDQKLSPETIAKLQPALEARGMPFAVARMLQPWVVATAVSVPVCETLAKHSGEPVLDAVIGRKAQADGKQLVGLETIEEQFAAMASLPAEFHLGALRETLELGTVAEDVMETMKQLYMRGETGMVMPMLKFATPKTSESGSYAHFQRQLIENRNALMAERALPVLEKGNAFIAIGALHLPGKTGLVQAFRDAGYTVSRAD